MILVVSAVVSVFVALLVDVGKLRNSSRGEVHVNHRTSTGLLVDVAALRKRNSSDGFTHVDVDCATTVVRCLVKLLAIQSN